MSMHVVQGDLLESDCTVIAHCCNCFSTMGAGIAKQIRNKYPEAYEADKTFGYSPQGRLGKYSCAVLPHIPLVIINLYGQYSYGRHKQHLDYIALSSSLEFMFQMLYINKDSTFSFPIKVGMPYGMGSGLAGGDFTKVMEIVDFLSDKFSIPVYWYKL